MLLFLFFILSQRAGICALPILSPSPPEAPSFDIATTASTGACTGRSLWDILWSCLATTFACTWVSVHPNVPFLRASKESTWRWRAYFMLVSLISPEIMVLWACKQLHGAQAIMQIVNSSYKEVDKKEGVNPESETKTGSQGADRARKTVKTSNQNEKDSPLWTLTHAHYLQMGGYRLQCLTSEEKLIPSRYGRIEKAMFAGGEKDVWELPLSFETMKAAFNDGLIDIPFIRKEILEKNGRDSLSKAIAMLQLTWFIIQIATRIHQSLAVTELELTTAALASLNIIMYIAWWSKPTDIQSPTIIMTKCLQEQGQRWMHIATLPSSSSETTQHADGACTSSPNPEPMVCYVIEQIGDKENANPATNYENESMKALRGSLISIVESPAKLVTGLFRLASELGVLIRGIWTCPYVYTNDQPSKATLCARFPSNVRKTISLICRIVLHLFLASIYYPVLAILGSGRRSQPKTSSQYVGKADDQWKTRNYITAMDIENKSAVQLLFNNHTFRFGLDMAFFCEDVASAPFLCLSAFSGAVFGMIHCVAWNFELPSHAEQIMWRTCSSVITGLCVCIMVAAPGYIIFKLVFHRSTPTGGKSGKSKIEQGQDQVKRRLSNIIAEEACSVFAICFVLTRLSLLTLSIIELRSLPASAFDTVQWSGFIPHI